MNVTQVAICPSEASNKAGRPALTPELLAASGARYSRNNEGLQAILSKIDPDNLEKSVDSIFRMVDYGHQSIADMVPVAMFIDDVSLWLAYYLWTLCPTAGGQESSTRYLKLSLDGLVPPDRLGIPEEKVPEWKRSMDEAYHAYQAALKIWETIGDAQPALMGIPRSLMENPSDAARKRVARMKRNYAFDRARYFLPAAASTNVMLIMSARGWVTLCQYLLSHPLPEPQQLGEMIRRELALSAPRMMKYARPLEPTRQALGSEFTKCRRMASAPVGSASSGAARLEIMGTADLTPADLKADLEFHPNRYAPVGSSLQRMAVRFGWSAIGFAEIRDLNRHRTGTKYCPFVPQGFYYALDQFPQDQHPQERAELEGLSAVGHQASAQARALLSSGDPAYVYRVLLGTEFPFEHLTTADKFIYEAELRTGLGAHFRYARHLRDALALFYEKFPAVKGLILEGSAEPE